MEKKKGSLDWKVEFEMKKNEILKSMNNKQVKVERNSFLEPFDVDAFLDKRSVSQLGASKIVGSGRGIFGTSAQGKK